MSVAVVSREGATQSLLPVSVRPPVSPAAVSLLAQAKRGILEASGEREPGERFIISYLSALRAAAAVLSASGRPHRGRARPASVWILLESLAPELKEWAIFFAENSATRSDVQAGINHRLNAESADELLRQAGEFLEVARRYVYGRY